MQNYSITTTGFWLHFLVNGDGTEWIDADLPTPNWFKKFEHSYLIGWQIDGYFATTRNQAYLNDIIARMIFTLPIAEKLNYKPNNELQIDKIYKLKEFKSLKSLPSKFKGYEYAIKPEKGHDRVFWAIKWKTEQIIEEQGEGRPVVFDLLHSWATTHFVDDVKDKSTLKAKCRSVWEWYYDRDWTIPERRKSEMSRSEHMKKVNEKRKEENRRKVANLITGIFADDYKTKSGRWNIAKIAKELGMGRDTVRKYLKELEYIRDTNREQDSEQLS